MIELNLLQSNELALAKQMFIRLSDDARAQFMLFAHALQNQGMDLQEILKSQTISCFLKEQKYENGRPEECPFCHEHYVVKNGTKKGAQRYLCRECGRSFGDTENSILKSTKKDLGVWELYFQCMMDKLPLRKIVERCAMSLKTVFVWRHKILDALQNMMNEVVLDGIVELDETYFRVSYKGQNKSILPRKPHKRGFSRFKQEEQREQLCVLCGVNLEGKSIAKISNLNHPSLQNLGNVFNNKIKKGSITVTDGLPGYSKLSAQNDAYHVEIASGCYTEGILNIQMINSYHSGLKRMTNHMFRGVSSKYLNNYIVYYNMVDFSFGSTIFKTNVMKKFTLSTECSRTYKNISNRPLVPLLCSNVA